MTCHPQINSKIKKFNIPFLCSKCGGIDFKLFPLRDLVLVFPSEVPESINGIILPEKIRESYRNEFGVILAIGKGYYNKKGEFVPTKLKTGNVVLYDKNVPWETTVDGYSIKLMTEKDVKGVLVD